MEKIIDIIDSIAHEKGLPPESAKEAFKTALVQTAKRESVLAPFFCYTLFFFLVFPHSFVTIHP